MAARPGRRLDADRYGVVGVGDAGLVRSRQRHGPEAGEVVGGTDAAAEEHATPAGELPEAQRRERELEAHARRDAARRIVVDVGDLDVATCATYVWDVGPDARARKPKVAAGHARCALEIADIDGNLSARVPQGRRAAAIV